MPSHNKYIIPSVYLNTDLIFWETTVTFLIVGVHFYKIIPNVQETNMLTLELLKKWSRS